MSLNQLMIILIITVVHMTLLFLLLIPWVAQVSSTLFQALRQLQDEHDTIKSLEMLEDEISEESLGSKEGFQHSRRTSNPLRETVNRKVLGRWSFLSFHYPSYPCLNSMSPENCLFRRRIDGLNGSIDMLRRSIRKARGAETNDDNTWQWLFRGPSDWPWQQLINRKLSESNQISAMN